jgi:hypothetical protein
MGEMLSEKLLKVLGLCGGGALKVELMNSTGHIRNLWPLEFWKTYN